jgi:hypothetical protein
MPFQDLDALTSDEYDQVSTFLALENGLGGEVAALETATAPAPTVAGSDRVIRSAATDAGESGTAANPQSPRGLAVPSGFAAAAGLLAILISRWLRGRAPSGKS